MSAIGKGDWVEALITSPPEYGFRAVSRGILYCVEALIEAVGVMPCDKCGAVGGVGILLIGDAPNVAGTGWCPCGFKPIYRPNSDLIRQLEQPAPDAVRELVPTN